MNKTKPFKKGQIRTREELIFALSWAAELEHGLTCIYLFAAFTMKRFREEGIDDLQQNQIRNWQGTVLAVAMQEMEHLGYVCNLLNSIGGPQHFNRPNLPQPPSYYSTEGAFTLEKFNKETIKRFMEFEKPAPTNDASGEVLGTGLVPDIIHVFDHHTVQDLYNSILEGFDYLYDKLGDKLFIGNENAQLEDGDIVVGYANHEYGINLQKVVDLASAKKAIDIIVEQGEGILLDSKITSSKKATLQGQYQKLVDNIKALQQLDFKKKGSARKLFSIGKELINNLEEVPAGSLDKSLQLLLSKNIVLLKKILVKASQSLQSPKRLSTARDKMVEISVYDVEGILLSGFTIPGSHYLRFWQIYQEMKKLNYDPSRSVVDNPALRHHADNATQEVNLVTHPYTFKTLEVFNASYEAMVQMLILIFSFSGISNAERTLLINTAFFPFMTMVIRPLSEVLTLLPAYEDQKGFDAPRAGPAFEYYLNIAQMPQVDQGWEYLYERMTQISDASNNLNPPKDLNLYLQPALIKKVEQQISSLQGNLARMAQNFKIGFNL
ncbi:MAG: ferritin-like domain-containing protein [Saprospiraceae bacterium]|nr:ferritin-like domain-containing protein [Saprospiraceae bacterium]